MMDIPIDRQRLEGRMRRMIPMYLWLLHGMRFEKQWQPLVFMFSNSALVGSRNAKLQPLKFRRMNLQLQPSIICMGKLTTLSRLTGVSWLTELDDGFKIVMYVRSHVLLNDQVDGWT